MLKLYGNARSRAMRCMWMLEETGHLSASADAFARALERAP